MLKNYQIVDGRLAESAADVAAVMLYINPSDVEKKYLINELLLDEHTLQSALDPEELGRVEFESNHAALIVKKPKRYCADDKFLFKISSIGLFLFADRLIIVSSEDASLFDGKMFTKIRSHQDLMLKIIYRCIVHFEEHLRVVRAISDELEVEINSALTNKDLRHMFNVEKSLVYYLNAINSNGRVIDRLKLNTSRLAFSVEDLELLEDVLIENGQCYEQSSTYSAVLSSMMDAWASIVSNNLNIRIKMLTILMICIMMPTMILALFSMNVQMPFPQEGTILPFWMIVGAASFSSLSIVVLWRIRKW